MATTKANGMEIYFETFGDPADETLLLVNGLGTQATGNDVGFCELLVGRGLRVVRFDNRDVGFSTHIDAEPPDMLSAFATATSGGAVDAPYTLADMAADAVGLLDSLDVATAHVFGSSMGGMIAQTISIEHPERVSSLTSVMSTTGEVRYGTPDPEVLASLATIMVPSESREDRIASGVALAGVIGTVGGWAPDQVRLRVAAQVDRSYDPQGTARQMAAVLASGDRAEGLATLDVPTMVLHGDADRLVDISGGRRTAELVPDAEFRVMEAMGHDLPPSYWDRVIDAVADLMVRAGVAGKDR